MFPILLLLVVVISPLNVATANPDSLQWILEPFPPDETVTLIRTFHDTLTWVITDRYNLYRKVGESWQPEPLIPGEKKRTIFALAENDVWLAVRLNSIQRECLKHFDGEKWRIILTPNTVPIIDLFFLNPNDGWAVCEWGEIMHYDGNRWERVRSPTNYHLTHIQMASPNRGWICGESRGKGIILEYRNRRWHTIYHQEDGEARRLVVRNDSLAWFAIRLDYFDIFEIHGKRLRKLPLPFPVDRKRGAKIFHKMIDLDGDPGLISRDGRYFRYRNEKWLPVALHELTGSHQWHVFNGKLQRLRVTEDSKKNHPNVSFGFITQEIPGSGYECGVAVGDINSDGYLDVYVVAHNGINHLISGSSSAENPFILGSTAAAEIAGIAGKIKQTDDTQNASIFDAGVSLADIENDGDLDLYVCSLYRFNLLYVNDGSGRFTEMAQYSGVAGEAMAFSELGIWGDLNNDGYLDLFVANQLKSDVFYLNDGTGRFIDFTREAGLESQWGQLSPVFADIDDDNDLDLFIPHQHGRLRLMQNQGVFPQSKCPRFIDITTAAGLDTSLVASIQCGAFADIDNDGDLDLFISIYLLPDRLYLNNGKGYFTDISGEAGFIDSTKSKGAIFFDADNDGFQDLFVGHDGPHRFYHNQGDGTFKEMTKEMGLTGEGSTAGIATGDFSQPIGGYNTEGALDLYVANSQGPSSIYYNTCIKNSYLKFKLRGTISNIDAIGAKIYLYDAGHAGERAFLRGMRQVQAGSGYCSMSSTVVHFGTKSNRTYDVCCVFPSGIEVIRKNLAPGQTIQIDEQTGLAKIVSESTRWSIRNLKEPTNRREAGLCILILGIIWLALRYCRKKKWGNRISRATLIVLPVLICGLIKTLVPHSQFWLYDGLSSGLSLLAIGFGVWINYAATQKVSRDERLDELLIACRAFEHSQWHASFFNQLGLLFNNIQPNQKVGDDIQQLMLETIGNFYQFIFPQVQRIELLARQLFDHRAPSDRLKATTLELSRNLDESKVRIAMDGSLTVPLLRSTPELISRIQTSLRRISDLVDDEFSTPLLKVLNKLIQSSVRKDVAIEFQNQVHEDEINIRIRLPELLFVLENLLSNAFRAMSASHTKRIIVRLEKKDGYVLLHLRDTGCGIPEAAQSRLFENGFTSKSSGRGGFGLYHSRVLLKKYGGDIYLDKSVSGKGTEFCIRFRVTPGKDL
ncbi:VCBS repeat-containing protein [candidate division KSB1 bacterium]|nr:VCBS repeat-containing protein [candidate division KSB1 bacterium]